ncbi:MAG: hypothetical protein BZY80_01165 [SAR202 cluster bacterium Io17-Chloro-G2]|nr:MAG: hypothetical protein BZY80_01165 [SAR202 cluster bacterium Io17-Chloro-G2]
MTESLGAAVAMGLFIVLSSVTFLVLLDVWDLQSSESIDNAALLTERINTRVSIINTTAESGCDTYTIDLTNPGKTSIADFSKLDVIADYPDVGGNRVYRRLDYVTSAVSDNEWALNSIAPDTRDPNAWNPGETVVFDLKVSPTVSTTISGTVVVATPFGVTDNAYLGC